MADSGEYVSHLLRCYGSEDACAADLLCDRHDRAAVAFTVIEPDLSSADINYGELRRRSEQGAAALAALGVVRGTQSPR